MKFLTGVFNAMGLQVQIKMEYKNEEETLNIDFEGEDMGILIGQERTDSGFSPVSYQSCSK